MMSGAIFDASFDINVLHKRAYELAIQFSNEEGNKVSEKKFTFIQKQEQEKGTIVDLFTKNGIVTTSITKVFNSKDVKAIKSASEKLKSLPSEISFVSVFDFQEVHNKYLPCCKCEQTISNCEQLIYNFFAKSSDNKGRALKIKEMLPLDFVIFEGSLKYEIFQKGPFSEGEIEFLNSKQGAQTFCKCAEFFMNAFKLGQEVDLFPTCNFVKSISPTTIFHPYQRSAVLYPPLYKDLYSPQGSFSKTLENFFVVSGDCDSSGVTTMHVERKL